MAEQLKTAYRPSEVSSPGTTLREVLEYRSISQAELAARSGRPQKTISEIVNGKAAITPETALQLELVLGVPASFWTSREAKYREYLARKKQRERLRGQLKWVEKFPIKSMIDLGWISKHQDATDQLTELLEFFGVASPDEWEAIAQSGQVAFRASAAYESDSYATSAWLRKGLREAEFIAAKPYDEKEFRIALQEIRGLTPEPPEIFQPRVIDLCRSAGVAVAFVPELPGCRTHGATRWLSPRKALIQLSLRYKTDDQLWFSFFHEAGHLLLHGKREVFVENGGDNTAEEEEASQFASDFLIPPSDFARLRDRSVYSKVGIAKFAAEIGISPGIVVGRLQHEGLLPYSHCNGLKQRLRWIRPQ